MNSKKVVFPEEMPIFVCFCMMFSFLKGLVAPFVMIDMYQQFSTIIHI